MYLNHDPCCLGGHATGIQVKLEAKMVERGSPKSAGNHAKNILICIQSATEENLPASWKIFRDRPRAPRSHRLQRVDVLDACCGGWSAGGVKHEATCLGYVPAKVAMYVRGRRAAIDSRKSVISLRATCG